MFLSRAAEVALLALPLLDPAGPAGPGRGVRALAEATRVPAPYLAKVLQDLARKGILRSKRGRSGGFVLGRPAAEITLADVLLAVEGKDDLASAHPPLVGPAGALLEPLRRRFFELMSSTMLERLRKP